MRSVGDWQVCELLRFKGRCLPFSWFLCGQIMLLKCPDVIHPFKPHAFIHPFETIAQINLLPDTALGSCDTVAQRTDSGER